MISGYELNFNVLNNNEFIYEYIRKIRNRITLFENRIFKHKDEIDSNPKYFDEALIYNDYINNYKDELTFIYKEMKNHILNKVEKSENKYIKSLFRNIHITYDTHDRIPLKKLQSDYFNVYGYITLKNLKDLLNEFWL